MTAAAAPNPAIAKGRILAWPRQMLLNAYFKTISDGLERHGWVVEDFTYLRALAGRYDVLHIHYPSFPFRNRWLPVALVRLFIAVALLSLASMRARKVAWTVHNLGDHERYHPWLEARFMAWFTDRVNLTIHLSESGRRAALERFPRLVRHPSVVIPHPYYKEASISPEARERAAEKLGLAAGGTVMLVFGMVRRYKNVPELLRVFSGLQGEHLRLIVAGSIIDAELEREIRQLASDPRIVLSLKQVSEVDLELYFSAASLVVAPYRDILNSGAAFLSLSRARPILVPNRGALAELQAKVGSDWVRLYRPPLTTGVLQAALDWAAVPRAGLPTLGAFAPDVIAAANDSAFDSLIAASRAERFSVLAR
jgi:beta-1,4-mannosyltransferase